MTRFVSNEEFWDEIQRHVSDGRRARAAVAYFGRDGAKLLKLKSGDTLVVDMSITAVRQGVTDPREVKKLKRAGVNIFSRGSLHAKFFLIDRSLIAGSANVSHNSKDRLDEAGIITSDPAALRRASQFFKRLCTEPVGDEYLKKCIAEYRPPKFKAAIDRSSLRSKRSHRVIEAKLWFIGGLKSLIPRDEDAESIARIERRHTSKLKQPERTEVTWIRYWRLPKVLRRVKVGDWVVDCTRDGGRRYVGTPRQMLGVEDWVSARGTRYKLMLFEEPTNGQSMSLSEFKRRIGRANLPFKSANPRTVAIEDQRAADDILRMWTATGKISARS